MLMQRHTLVNALRIASEEYAKCAKADPSLKDQFERQALQALDMWMAIEEAPESETIRLED